MGDFDTAGGFPTLDSAPAGCSRELARVMLGTQVLERQGRSISMISINPNYPQVRILVLESDFAVSLHVRTAIHMSGIWSAVRTVHFDGASLYSTCAGIRSGESSPDLVLAEC